MGTRTVVLKYGETVTLIIKDQYPNGSYCKRIWTSDTSVGTANCMCSEGNYFSQDLDRICNSYLSFLYNNKNKKIF
jgi:hypothetical protein